MADTNDIKVFDRLSQLEKDVSGLNVNVGTIHDGLHSIKQQLNAMEKNKETKWGVIISGVGLFITIGVLALTPIYTNISRLDYQHERHADSSGHPGMMREVASLSSKIESHITMDDQRHQDLLDRIAILTKQNSIVQDTRFSMNTWEREGVPLVNDVKELNKLVAYLMAQLNLTKKDSE